MSKIMNITSIIIGVLGGIFINMLGAWDTMLMILIMMMAIDYLSGIIKGVYNKKLSSQMGWRGLLKKVATMCIVAVANLVERLTGGTVGIRDIVIMFYVANEGLSILENVAAIGNIIPQPLKDILLQIRDNKDEKRDEQH